MSSSFILAALLTLATPAIDSIAPDEQQAGRAARSTSKPGEFDDFQIPAGTTLRLKLRTPFSSATASVNDQVQATLSSPVIHDGVELLPVDSILIGRISAVVRASRRTPLGSVTFAFSLIQHAGTKDRAAVPTQRIILEASAARARTGRGWTRQKPTDIKMAEGASLVAITTEPLIVQIPK